VNASMSDEAEKPAPIATPVIQRTEKPKKSGFKEEMADLGRFILKLAVFVFILRSFIVAPFNIPSESMVPRLLTGDYLLVAKWPYGYSKYSLPFSMPLIPGQIMSTVPERGDVAVFKAPPSNDVDYIKRIIGLPGDRIQMKMGQLFINDQPVPKKRIENFIVPVSPNTNCNAPEFVEKASDGSLRCSYPQFEETLPNGKTYRVLDLSMDPSFDSTEVFEVPQGYLFAMGDNRDNSLDSRFLAEEGKGIGLVPQENLVGRALVSVFSTDGSAEWIKPWTWFTAARWSRIGEGF
jgi:signal peptidase I